MQHFWGVRSGCFAVRNRSAWPAVKIQGPSTTGDTSTFPSSISEAERKMWISISTVFNSLMFLCSNSSPDSFNIFQRPPFQADLCLLSCCSQRAYKMQNFLPNSSKPEYPSIEAEGPGHARDKRMSRTNNKAPVEWMNEGKTSHTSQPPIGNGTP